MDHDFNLKIIEGRFNSKSRRCSKIKRISYGRYDDGLLVRVNPPYYSSKYPISNGNIGTLLLAPHYQNDSLFPVSEWPMHVYMYLILARNPEVRDILMLNEIEKIAFGIIYLDSDKLKFKIGATRPD